MENPLTSRAPAPPRHPLTPAPPNPPPSLLTPPPQPSRPPGSSGWRYEPIAPLPTPRPAVAGWVLAVAAFADVAIRLTGPGVAASLSLLALVGLLAAAGRIDGRVSRAGAVLVVFAAALLSLRDSPWVSSVVMTAVLALVVLLADGALTNDRSRPWVAAIRSTIVALHDLVPWLDRAGGWMFRRSSGRLVLWARATISALAVTTVLVALLASGDAAFEWLVARFDVVSWLGHVGVVLILAIPTAVLALLATRGHPSPNPVGSIPPARQRSLRSELLTALWAVAVVLVVWCGLQIMVVAGGANEVLASQGITAAEYARQGFFQLVAVTAVALVVLNAAHGAGREPGPTTSPTIAPITARSDPAQRVPAFVVGAALTVLIIVSFSRLGFYVGAFGLTMLRLLVATFLAWLALMTACSVARSLRAAPQTNWLPTTAVLSAALFAVLFGAVNPEARVAAVNLDRSTVAAPVDVRYLTRSLGPDAKPVVAEYDWDQVGGRPDTITDWLCPGSGLGIVDISTKPTEPSPASAGYGLLGWNLSRARAEAIDC